MARGVSKKGQTIEIISTPLEENIPVKYAIVGRIDWLSGAFEPQALEGNRILKVSDGSDLARMKEWLDKHINHYTDIETTGESKELGLDPWRKTSRVVLFQIGNTDQVFVLQPELIPELKEYLESTDYIHVFQNGVFDWKYIYAKYKIHINRIYDTMLAEQLLTSGKNGIRVGLDKIARRRPPYRMINKATREEFIEFKGKFTKKMVDYAVRDIVLMPPIMEDQMADLKRLKMEAVAQDEFDLVPVTGSMELFGVPFSHKTLRLALKYYSYRQEQLELQILAAYDTSMVAAGNVNHTLIPELKAFSFDLNSPTKKLAALRALGFELDNVQRDTLEEIDHPVAALLAEYSAVVKINSTYGMNLIERINPETKRLQVEFHQLGSGDRESGKKGTIATGRYSSDFQQLPKAANRYDEVRDNTELQQVGILFEAQIQDLLKETGEINGKST